MAVYEPVGSPDTARGWLDAARAALPGLDVPEAVFRHAVADRPDAAIAHAADLYLACGCALGLPAALRRFEDDHVARIPAWLGAAEKDPAVIDEVCQRVRTRVLVGERPRIAGYAATGPLGAWVRVVAVREHAQLHRDAPPPGADDARLALLVRTAEVSPELAALRDRYLPVLGDAFRAGVEALAPRDRTLVRLAYADDLSLEAIGKIYGVNKSTVSRWLAAARAQVLAAAVAHARAHLHASDAEVESLLGLVRSNLELSLHGLL